MEIKPCPFCGGNGIANISDPHPYIYCERCDVRGPHYGTIEKAIAAWNKRYEPEFERVESGKVQIGDDWPGVFIRGDHALYVALLMKDATCSNEMYTRYLQNYAKVLESANAHNGIEPVMLKRVK